MFFPFLTDSAAAARSPMSTSVERALQVEEILTRIFRHLSPYAWDRKTLLTVLDRLNIDPAKDFSHLGVDTDPRTDNRRALVQCARVSRTIAPHALKVLWRTLPDLRPLAQLLNAMAFSYADVENGVPYHTFPFHIELPTHPRGWLRYRWYASCVVGVRSVIDHNALEEWSDKGGPPLLPSLQSARFAIDPRAINRTLRMFNPCLRDLTVNFDSPSSQITDSSRLSTADVLMAAAASAPTVEMLNVTFRGPPKNLTPVLPRFSNLRLLVITGWMTPSLHEAISALEHLEMLYVKLYWSRRAEASMLNLPTRSFCPVKTLVALTFSEPIFQALKSTELPLLERARVEIWPHSSDATDMLIQTMGHLITHAPKLHSITLTTRSAFAHGDRPPPRLATLLEPMLHHPVLQSVSITLEDNYAFALPREDILGMVSAWPNMVHLTLAHAPTRNEEGLPSVMTVLELANALPQLRTLVLCARFDCTGRDTWRDAAIPPHALRKLFLALNPETGSYRPDKTWRALASVLDRCFPSLSTKCDLVRPAVVGSQAMELWQSVMQHLQDIRAGGRRSLSPA